MYITLTTRCNMSCAHCCSACTEKGEDMSLEVFRSALAQGDGGVTLGGGEPTLHPLFWQMCMEAVASADVWLATNGSQTTIALALAALARKGVLGCALSQDSYHDNIDDSVIRAFTRPRNSDRLRGDEDDAREIRNVDGREVNQGRCDFGIDDCCCPDLIVMPNGSVRACGCCDAPAFGNVKTEIVVPTDWQVGECWKTQKELL